jgi:Ulp1 family protease
LLANLDSYLCKVNNRRKPICFMHTMVDFNSKTKEKAYSRLRRIIRKQLLGNKSVFECSKVIINEHVMKSHYVLFVIFLEEQFIGYYDSYNTGPDLDKFDYSSVVNWLEYEWGLEQGKIPFDRSCWKFGRVEVVKQGNDVDCAFHAIRNALLLQMDLPMQLYQVVPTAFILYFNRFA